MVPHRLSKPSSDWPVEIRSRFDAAFAHATPHQAPRLRQALGRWLLAAERDDLPPDLITPALLEQRTAHLEPAMAAAMRQALHAVFPQARVFGRESRVEVESKRMALAREIERNWHRLPEAWQQVLKPKLHFCPEGLEDGLLVEAWSVDTLRSRLQTVWGFFDFCRDHGLPSEITRQTVARRLDDRQDGFRTGTVSIKTVYRELQRLKNVDQALFPEHDWAWADAALKNLQKKANLQPSRNDARIVDLAELRMAAACCCDVAAEWHKTNPSFRAQMSVNKLARTGLAISLLVNSPIRLESLSTLDLRENFDPTFTRLYLGPHQTKDKKRDERLLTPQVQQQLRDYLNYHRAAVAPTDETALFVGSRGKPVARGYLSQTIGDQCQKLFGKRVTPQVIRNIVAGFIVSQAPERANLATVLLNHSSPTSTESYRANGTQVIAAQKLRSANDEGRKTYGIVPEVSFTAAKKPRRGRATPQRRSRRG
ncbi:hypothetical protein [uncultured Sulfitobacter sp.]|uniref:hypothetical protein n=1 Tax=Sulfitobacter sp. SH22 TaxID=3421172 RepID=UPI0025F866D5|nr:hypothetical protein [uncultured Sulfitobacter sp.]